MPSTSFGLTGTEIQTFVVNFFGNQSSDFSTYLTTVIPLAEQRYCKVHNWNFLNKVNLPLTVVSGTTEYTLDSGTIGYYMPSSDVKSIFCPSSNTYLRKVSLDEIRRMDPDGNDGSSGAHLTHWCESGDNKIVVYPPTFADVQLRVDGKVTPTALYTLSNYPTIPLRYQSAFINYVVSVAMLRENDSRADSAAQAVRQEIREDISTDLSTLAGGDEPRMRALQEMRLDGNAAQNDPLNMLFSASNS